MQPEDKAELRLPLRTSHLPMNPSFYSASRTCDSAGPRCLVIALSADSNLLSARATRCAKVLTLTHRLFGGLFTLATVASLALSRRNVKGRLHGLRSGGARYIEPMMF